jgi:hypothetical protein
MTLRGCAPGLLSLEKIMRRILYFDAATCLAMGLALVLFAQPLAPLLGLPVLLLEIAGALLLPIGGFIAWVASASGFLRTGAWLVIAGNAAWVLASFYLLLSGAVAPKPLGYAFVLVQALAVALIAALEYASVRRIPA